MMGIMGREGVFDLAIVPPGPFFVRIFFGMLLYEMPSVLHASKPTVYAGRSGTQYYELTQAQLRD